MEVAWKQLRMVRQKGKQVISAATAVFHWTETQEPFHLRRQHQGEEFLVQAKFLKVITILNTELYSKKYIFKVER